MKAADNGSIGSIPAPISGTAGKIASSNSQQHYKDWPNDGAFNALGDQKEPIELQVTGYFPSHLAGTLYRTGPGGYLIPAPDSEHVQFEVQHWFDGFTTMHKFALAKDSPDSQTCDRITYSSYSQTDELIEHACKTGNLNGVTFGQRDPCDSFYKKLKSTFTPLTSKGPHMTNISVVLRPTLPAEKEHTPNRDGRKLITVTTDAHVSKHFDADTLEPLGVTDQAILHPSLTGPLSASHACHDPITGDVYNYNLALGRRPTYRIFRASPSTSQVDILAEISASDIPASYVHSLFLTENYVVLCVWTAHYQAYGAKILWSRNVLDAIAPFDPKAKTVWLVVDRKGGRGLVKKFYSTAMFSFHTTNAWEEPRRCADGKEEVDLVCELFEFPNCDILHRFYYDRLVSNGTKTLKRSQDDAIPAGLSRYRLNAVSMAGTSKAAGKAERTMYIPAPASGDLPTIHPSYRCKPHRYVYAITDRGRSSFVDGIVKTDTQNETCIYWGQDKCTPGEPIFVPTPGAEDEDDGHVLSVVFDGASGRSFLICLDAKSLSEVGRADVTRPVGLGFHGIHLRTK